MRMIEIAVLDTGAHNNQTYHGTLPDGWAVVPDALETENFPFGEVAVEVIDGIPTVTRWEAGTMPEPAPVPDPEPTAQDDTDAMLIDHEYRLTLLELGLV